MKVVVVNEGVGYPPNRGNWLRTLNLLLPLASRHDLTYLCRGDRDPRASEQARAFYAEHGIRAIITGDHPYENRGPAFYARLAANLLSPLPYSIAAHRSSEVRRQIRRIAREEKVDVWQFESLSYADTLFGTAARVIVMAHNVESLIWQRLHETEASVARRWYIGHQWRKYERFEGRVLRGASRVVAVSEEDAALMQRRFGVVNAAVVDNGVDVDYFATSGDRAAADPREILFLGSLDWRPNIDAIDLLLTSIMPQVVAAEPGARLSIVGRNPSPALVRRVEADPHAELHANVPDVRPYLARAGVLAVPLRIGGGSRLKILEAIAAGLPVVSTRVGCEGLVFTAGRDLAVVESETEMAAALVANIRDPGPGVTMTRSGKTVIDAHYRWTRLADRLESVWESCLAGEAATANT
jgi:glycosyltransferase involved in cell wall biosynthesis